MLCNEGFGGVSMVSLSEISPSTPSLSLSSLSCPFLSKPPKVLIWVADGWFIVVGVDPWATGRQ